DLREGEKKPRTLPPHCAAAEPMCLLLFSCRRTSTSRIRYEMSPEIADQLC
ncbi:hypothetical protein PanWU01x14_199030, partial [Parasponia andersonii]